MTTKNHSMPLRLFSTIGVIDFDMKTLIKSFVILMAASSASLARTSDKGNGYVYDSAVAGDQRAVVFSDADSEVSIQNKVTASTIAMSHGFGGVFRYCSNGIYYCLSGPINVSIPKDLSTSSSEWTYNNFSCKSRSGRRRGVYVVICKNAGDEVESTVEFSHLRGILSFRNTPIGGGVLFKLRGRHGIFSVESKVH